MKLFVLYLVTNLGPSFTFEYSKTMAIFKTELLCNVNRERLAKELAIKPPMRMECKTEDYYVN